MAKKDPVKFALFGAGTRGELDLGHFFIKNRKKIKYWAVAELDPVKRAFFVEKFKIPKENAFADWRDLLEKPKLADAVLNALPCHLHHESTIGALKAGYDVLLEKPMAHTAEECVHLYKTSRKYKQRLSIFFENRYNKIYQRIKELLDQGIIGQLYDITCAEHIGYYHYIMSYVRGIHSRADQGNSFMIAKGIHDIDLITWFTQSKAKRVSSFGDLSYFNNSNVPEGAPERCIEGCPVQETCVFDALKQYIKPGRPILPLKHMLNQDLSALIDVIKEPRFRTLASSFTHDISEENILKLLKEREEGKCVFRSRNGVTDHQTSSIEYENGVTCSFSLSAFSLLWERLLELRGPKGEIWSRDFTGKIETRLFYPLKTKKERIRYNGLHHGGGDQYLLLDFAKTVRNDDLNVKSMTDVENCLESHLIALAIEEARHTGKVVDMAEFRSRAEENARKLST